jgi:arabinan endo-1,5-alpha-L-arabinosidase
VVPCLLVVCMLGFPFYLYASDYVNPLKGDLGVHDPVMIKADATYHIYATGRLIAAKTSTDRITWRNTSSGLASPSWISTEVPANNGTDFWAPDISFRNNQYWLYYSVSTFGKNTSAIGLATSPTLASPAWTDRGVVIASRSGDNFNCIDPNVFQDTDGKVWLSFGSFWSGIKMVEVDPATGKPATGSPAIISLATHSSGIEAPFLFKWGYYFLFVSWDVCCKGVNSTYKIVAGRSTRVDGGYVDKAGKAMTSGGGMVLDTGDAVRIGPGHNGIFIENDTVFCVNHYYDAAANGASKLQIRPLYWDEGWPSFIGSQTGPPSVKTAQKPAVPAPKYASNVTLIVGSSGVSPRQAKGRVYTVSGKEITAVSGVQKGRMGVFIVDLRPRLP